jgi:hypothetical protein
LKIVLKSEQSAPQFHFLTERTVDRLDTAEIETYFGALLNRKQFERSDKQLVTDSLRLAKDVHAEDWRTTGSYINHPMRVAITALRYFDGADSNIIAACLLHDTIEKHPEKVIDNVDMTVDGLDSKSQALAALELLTNEEVASTVQSVTNPKSIHRDSNVVVETKNQIYARHVKSILDSDRNGMGPGVVKFCDYIDNFVKNYKTAEPLRHKLDIKYDSLSSHYREWLNSLPESLISSDNLYELKELISQGCEEQFQRLRRLGRPAVGEMILLPQLALQRAN